MLLVLPTIRLTVSGISKTERISLAGSSAVIADEAPDVAGPSRVDILYGPLTSPPGTRDIVSRELAKPRPSGPALQPRVTEIPTDRRTPNPFAISTGDFAVGEYLVRPGEHHGGPPKADPDAGKWFDDLIAQGKTPDVFVIGGHNVISEGWHNHRETAFLFLPTLRETVATNPSAKQVFGNVKLAILWGCNTMTNLEPHAPGGAYLSPEDIRQMYERGGTSKNAVLGAPSATNTLEFYKSRLAREYGPGTAQYEYTRNPKAEVCTGPGKYENCAVTDLDRILPESGLYDGTHRFNHPAMMKELFPNAYLVLGYSSASPSEPQRAAIFKELLRRSYRDLAGQGVTNILEQIIDPATPEPLREKIIETVRANWTKVTYDMNRHRPSGSITPRLPHLDANGIFNVSVSRDTPLFAPYEKR